MGQLEKYGLYVLCLVIFLILGVAIFADGSPVQALPRRDLATLGSTPSGLGNVGQRVDAPQPKLNADDIANLFRVAEPPAAPPQPANRAGSSPSPSPAPAPKSGEGTAPPASPPSPSPAVDPGTGTQPANDVRAVHVVRAGDTFDKIARTVFGRASLAQEIQRLNPKLDPTKLRVGTEVVLPSRADLAKKYPDVAAAMPGGDAKKAEPKDVPKGDAAKNDAAKNDAKPAGPAGTRSYTIRKGDTFEGVALALLGKKTRTDEIKKLNPTLDPTKLKVGQTILVPAK